MFSIDCFARKQRAASPSLFYSAVALALCAAAWLPCLAAAATAAPVKIGFSMSETGGLSAGGKAALVALQIWKDDVNGRGGLLGRPVELVFYDDQSSPALVPGIYNKLLDVDKVDFVISAYGTGQIAPAMPIVMQHRALFMALFGTGVNDEFHYDRYFQIVPSGKETALAPSRGFLETAMTMTPKPRTVAITGADGEYSQNALRGAREVIARLGLELVYDRTYPLNTVEYGPIMHSIQAVKPDVVFVASYPQDSVGMVRAASEAGLTTGMFGGGMIGLAFTSIKQRLGPLLNGVVALDVYVPEPTMKFPGIEDFLRRYQERAAQSGVDPLGYYLPPYAYAEMQILEQSIAATAAFDPARLAAYIHATRFSTIVGDVKFADNGEWEKSRLLFVQYQGVNGHEVDQFRQPGRQVILYPPEFKSGNLIYPFAAAQP